MENVEKNDKLIKIISVIIILVAGVVWYFPQTANLFASSKLEQPQVIFKTERKIDGPTYNYKNLIFLIEQFRKIEKSFYSEFETFVNKPQNLELLKNTLKELKEERSFFTRYLQKVKAYYKRFVPTRKHASLRYYFRILDDCVEDVEEMIERFDIYLKKQV